MVTQIPIILASNSPRRKELLERVGYTFTVMPSDCDEATDIRFPKDMVMELAGRKAENVYKKVCTDRAGTEAETQPFIVIGSDTVVALNGRILGKPIDYDDAYNTLNSLSGQTHNVYTGVSIMYYDGEKCRTKTFYENTEVTFYPMTHEEIVGYLATGDPFDKAGSYGIQTQGGLFVKGIKGSYDNVVGLPLSRLYHELNEMLYGQ